MLSVSRVTAFLVGLFMIGQGVWTTPVLASQPHVNIYSYRQEILMRPLLKAFTAETGIKVNIVSGKADALLQRLKSEGRNSPADLLLTADVARLVRAEKAGVLQPVDDATLKTVIPAQYRDDEGHWFGLSLRARVLFFAKDRVSAADLSSYEELTAEKWRGRLCVRSSANIYNQSLLSSMIAHKGEEAARQWAKGIVANFARRPQGGDRDQIMAVASGECDVAIANSYYYGRMVASKAGGAQAKAAQKVALFWPNQQGRGAHVNISGAGVTKSAKNRENAIALLKFLVSEKAQQIYAEEVFEYPVRAGAPLSPVLKSWGAFKADALPLADFAVHNRKAVMTFDQVGWR
ncbi:MAG: Fe(3+) ABC transporter substrate-binding protein [Kordiimonas sp.]|nr:Fe(3+) ABC transporter substrate-binding protein [Kordiimonas sp.]|tara:strand:+ start:1074 stop:2117 length:1044 start_codon:yes stop_codon:yes gene_type:complete